MNKIGPWSYIIGLVIAVLAGYMAPANTMIVFALGALGLLVGLLNVTAKEVMLFLLASIAFLVSANALGAVFASMPAFGATVAGMFGYLVIFTAPAAAVVAIKALYEISKD